MLLVDALYINNSGGLGLLKYLIDELNTRESNIFYILDERCVKIFDKKDNIIFLNPSLRSRYVYYTKYVKSSNYQRVLCFGNVPPPIRLNCPVYTYFHNVNMISFPPSFTCRQRMMYSLKKKYLGLLKSNTDFWIVQTSNSKNILSDKLNINIKKIDVIPFFKIDKTDVSSENREGYAYITNYTLEKNHLFLLKAWEVLFERKFCLELHLTLSKYPKDLEQYINVLLAKGMKISNHGNISQKEVKTICSRIKAIVYPSFNESFGLGIVEGLSYGCDVIGPNLDYINSICIPSVSFDLDSIDSLVNAIINYESGDCERSQMTTENKINDLIDKLV